MVLLHLEAANKDKKGKCLKSETTDNSVKGATKSYFMHYSCVVIILFNTGLYKSTFFTCYFGKLVFRLPVIFMLSACSVSNSM